ncbi:MAG: BrnA antitoxin family protein [Silvibacterium sp.]
MTRSKTISRTDWERVKKEIAADVPIPCDQNDGPYDPNDVAAVEAHWNSTDILDAKGKVIRRGRGAQKAPIKERITIRLSPEVVDRFRSGGKGWQGRMDDALREWLEHRR